MLENNQTLMNEQIDKPLKLEKVQEIDLKKGENRKLTLFSFKGKVVISIILAIYITLGLLIGIVYALTEGNAYVFLVLALALIVLSIVYPIVLTKSIKSHKKRYLLKTDSLDDLVEHLECPNYEEKVRMDNKKITFKNDDNHDYYDDYEEEIDSSTYLHAYDEIDIEEFSSNVLKFAEERGLKTDLYSIRCFLSAIMSSHLIELKSPNIEISKKFMDVLSEYLGRKSFYSKENPNWRDPDDILWKKQNNQLVETEILKSVLSASKNKGTLTFLSMVDVNYSKFENYFSHMLSFVNYPNRRLLLDVSSRYDNGIDPAGKVSIPKNIWFIIFSKQNITNKISEKVIKNLVSIEINATLIEESSSVSTHESISLEQLEYSVNKAADLSDISEEIWKKYDEFIFKLKEIVKLDLNDKYFYGIENFATMFVSTGGEESDAIDNVINSKILPLVLNLKDLDVSDIDFIINTIESVFDTEVLSSTIKSLNKLKEN